MRTSRTGATHAEGTGQRAARLGIEGCGALVALSLPVVVDLSAGSPFDAAKSGLLLVASAALAGLWIALRLGGPRRPAGGGRSARALDRSTLPVVAYALVGAAATIASTDITLSVGSVADPRGLAQMLASAVLFVVLADAVRATAVDWIVDAALVASVPTALYGFLQYAGLDPLEWSTDSISPMLSTLGRSNYLAAYLAMVAPLTLGRALSPGRGDRLRYGLLLALQASCAYLTLARAGWIALTVGIGCALAALGWARQSARFWLAAGGALVSGLILFFPLASGLVPPRLDSPARPTGEVAFAELRAASASARLLLWEATASWVESRPLLGHGPATYAEVYAANRPAAISRLAGEGRAFDDPHNILLGRAVDTGLVGLIAFGAAIASILWVELRGATAAATPERQTMLAATFGSSVAYLAQAMLNPETTALNAQFWITAALAVAASRGCRRRPPRRPSVGRQAGT